MFRLQAEEVEASILGRYILADSILGISPASSVVAPASNDDHSSSCGADVDWVKVQKPQSATPQTASCVLTEPHSNRTALPANELLTANTRASAQSSAHPTTDQAVSNRSASSDVVLSSANPASNTQASASHSAHPATVSASSQTSLSLAELVAPSPSRHISFTTPRTSVSVLFEQQRLYDHLKRNSLHSHSTFHGQCQLNSFSPAPQPDSVGPKTGALAALALRASSFTAKPCAPARSSTTLSRCSHPSGAEHKTVQLCAPAHSHHSVNSSSSSSITGSSYSHPAGGSCSSSRRHSAVSGVSSTGAVAAVPEQVFAAGGSHSYGLNSSATSAGNTLRRVPQGAQYLGKTRRTASPPVPSSSNPSFNVLFREYLDMCATNKAPAAMDAPKGLFVKLFLSLACIPSDIIDLNASLKVVKAVGTIACRAVMMGLLLLLPAWLYALSWLLKHRRQPFQALLLALFGILLFLIAEAVSSADSAMRAKRKESVFTASAAVGKLQTTPPPALVNGLPKLTGAAAGSARTSTATAIPTNTHSVAARNTVAADAAAGAVPFAAGISATPVTTTASAVGSAGAALRAKATAAVGSGGSGSEHVVDPKLRALKLAVIKLESAFYGNELTGATLPRDVLPHRVQKLCEEVGVTYDYDPKRGQWDDLLRLTRAVEEALGAE